MTWVQQARRAVTVRITLVVRVVRVEGRTDVRVSGYSATTQKTAQEVVFALQAGRRKERKTVLTAVPK